jgi:hypothetical protein
MIAKAATAPTALVVTNQVERPIYRLAGGMMPFMRKYSTICP